MTRRTAVFLLATGVSLSVLGVSPAPAQWLIQQWNTTTPLPFPMAGGYAVGYGNHIIYVAPPWGSFVGDMDQQSGEITSWRSTLPAPTSPFPVAPQGVVVGDLLVFPGYPQSAIGHLAADGSIAGWSFGSGTNAHATGARAVAASGNRIYVTGGGAPYVAMSSVETAYIASDGTLSAWTSLNPLPAPMIGGEAAVLGTGLFAYGGHSSTPGGDLSHAREVQRAEIYPDGTIGPWELVGFLLDTRSGSASLSFSGTLHITGGGLHGFLTNTVESAAFAEFGNTSAHEWSLPLPTTLSGHSAAVAGRFGYVLGGSSGTFGRNMQSAVYVAELGPANSSPIADAGADQDVPAGAACSAPIQLDGTGSYDPDGDLLVFTWSSSLGTFSGPTPNIALLPGTYEFTLTVADPYLNSEPDSVEIAVYDEAPPEIELSSASPNMLWPPNHKMVPVDIAISASDTCGGLVTCSLVSVSSNEPVNGTGDGDTAPDWQIVDADTVLLRAERAGNGPGRVYSVTSVCSDDAGNESSTVVEVFVPHSRKN